jgi:hypothetical protein
MMSGSSRWNGPSGTAAPLSRRSVGQHLDICPFPAYFQTYREGTLFCLDLINLARHAFCRGAQLAGQLQATGP